MGNSPTAAPTPAPTAITYSPPCLYGTTNTPSGCDPNRIKLCNELSASSEEILISHDENTDCSTSPKLSDTVEGNGENTYVVQFDGADGECLAIRMEGGECWGAHPNNGGNYNCQGRCGPGCGSWTCSNWGRDCLKHDVCSWYFSSSGGASDSNCGDEWGDAYNDWANNCFWGPCKGSASSCDYVMARGEPLSMDRASMEQESVYGLYEEYQNGVIVALAFCLLILGGCFCRILTKQRKNKYVAVHVTQSEAEEEAALNEE